VAEKTAVSMGRLVCLGSSLGRPSPAPFGGLALWAGLDNAAS
jgi:hypothetical protein